MGRKEEKKTGEPPDKTTPRPSPGHEDTSSSEFADHVSQKHSGKPRFRVSQRSRRFLKLAWWLIRLSLDGDSVEEVESHLELIELWIDILIFSLPGNDDDDDKTKRGKGSSS